MGAQGDERIDSILQVRDGPGVDAWVSSIQRVGSSDFLGEQSFSAELCGDTETSEFVLPFFPPLDLYWLFFFFGSIWPIASGGVYFSVQLFIYSMGFDLNTVETWASCTLAESKWPKASFGFGRPLRRTILKQKVNEEAGTHERESPVLPCVFRTGRSAWLGASVGEFPRGWSLQGKTLF